MKEEKGRLFLNYDGQLVVLSVLPPTGTTGVPVHLREKFASPEVAKNVAGTLAKRLKLRKRGSGWMRSMK